MRLGWQWWEPFATSVKPGSATGLCLMIRVGAGGEKRKKRDQSGADFNAMLNLYST